MAKRFDVAKNVGKILFGCFLFGVGFNLFLLPNDLNAGGITGLSMVLVHFAHIGTVGTITALVNIPLFALAGLKIGRRFFWYSLLGMLASAVFIDLMAVLPRPEIEPLLGALYGGALCGFGLGAVFSTGGSTGGSDILTRLWKRRFPNISIGIITTVFDLAVAALTGLAFRDVSRMLYSGVAIIVTGRIMDAVVYRFDYSKVALIISVHHEKIAALISKRLERGATYLQAKGFYSGQDTKVILTAVKRHQLAELKALVVAVDPDAFIILQEAHQVLGDGFSQYSKDSL